MQKKRANALKSMLFEAGYEEGDSLVVGVSGGPDSLALLHQLQSVLDRGALRVAHLDHGIRQQSAGDAQFVADLVREWELSFSGKRMDVPELASRQGWSLEEAAREARYEFLAEVAHAAGARVVAVGHTSDDQAETVLLHFLRGSGLTGLRGMLPVSPFPGDGDLKLIRPLLYTGRIEIESYCDRHDLKPIVDESNTDPTYLRNRIRRYLLPELAGYNPRIKNRLVQLATIASAEEELVSALLEEVWPELVVRIGTGWLCLNRRRFQDLPLALQRRAIRRAVRTISPDINDLSFKTVEQALDIAGRKESGIETMLPEGLTMLADYDTLLFSSASAGLQAGLPQLLKDDPLLLPVPGQIVLANDWKITAQPVEQIPDPITPELDPWQAFLDLRDQDILYVRTRQPGERMQPLGMDGHSSSLQDIMVNRKMASRLREQWPLVATNKHVVWLTGHIIDQRVKVSDNSRRIVRLKCERLGEER